MKIDRKFAAAIFGVTVLTLSLAASAQAEDPEFIREAVLRLVDMLEAGV